MPDDALRTLLLDWLDDNYLFGDARTLVRDDEMSWLDNGILDSLGFVKMVLFLEERLGMRFERKLLTRANFDGLGKILRYVRAHPGFRGVP